MNKTILLIIFSCLIFSQNLCAQIQAVTEYGDTIYVFDDGTWNFTGEKATLADDYDLSYLDEVLTFDTSTVQYNHNPTGKRTLKSKYGFFDIFYDEDIWERVPPAQLNDEAEFAFVAKESDIWCVVIAEEIEVGLENVVKIAMNNMREYTGGEIDLRQLEVREVNGFEVVKGVFALNFSGLDFIFDSYYYSDENGTVQFTTWTGANVHEKYEPAIEELLNGLVLTVAGK
ncbi:MAG: hypothetical protein AAF502_11270 [Bacteroidota bacterium]